jgi:soluble lytic murein transglycosylase-like protein
MMNSARNLSWIIVPLQRQNRGEIPRRCIPRNDNRDVGSKPASESPRIVIQTPKMSQISKPMSNTVNLEVIELARRIAAQHGLEPALVCAVIEQESGWNPWAVRYEPAFLSRYVAPQYTVGKFSATEAYTRSMSWGLMQVMGQVAREVGFAGKSLSELCDPATGIEVGCVVLASKLARARADVSAALLAWNGGANSNYPAEVLARIPNYSSKAVQQGIGLPLKS